MAGLPKDGIRLSSPSRSFGGASSIVGGCVEVCLQHIHLWWICSDIVFMLDLSDLCYSSLVTVVVLMRWLYGALARRLPDCLLQQCLTGSNEEEMFLVVTRWSMKLDVIFSFGVLFYFHFKCVYVVINKKPY